MHDARADVDRGAHFNSQCPAARYCSQHGSSCWCNVMVMVVIALAGRARQKASRGPIEDAGGFEQVGTFIASSRLLGSAAVHSDHSSACLQGGGARRHRGTEVCRPCALWVVKVRCHCRSADRHLWRKIAHGDNAVVRNLTVQVRGTARSEREQLRSTALFKRALVAASGI
eukprot:scaffold19466_cov129-Isochrysis_galbana.AAC.4